MALLSADIARLLRLNIYNINYIIIIIIKHILFFTFHLDSRTEVIDCNIIIVLMTFLLRAGFDYDEIIEQREEE